MLKSAFPYLGFGVGLRRPHYAHILAHHPAIDWFEVISENFMVAGGLAHVELRIRRVQDFLGRLIAIENVSSYLTFRDSRMTEWEFLRAVAEEADSGILLDINKIYVSAFNHRFSAEEYLEAIPRDRVVQFHLAGHSDHGTHLLDTHDHPVCDAVWSLYE